MRAALLAALALATLIPVTISAEEATPAAPERDAIERRAVEAMIWGMPAVNYDLMLQEMLTKTDGEVNQVVYWSKPLT